MPDITVCVSVNWEGLNLDGVSGLHQFNLKYPDIPITHFVSAAYFCRRDIHGQPANIDGIAETMIPAIKEGDEVAMHLHCWRSLGKYKNGMSYLTGHVQEVYELNYVGRAYQDTGFTVGLTTLTREDINELFDRSASALTTTLLVKLDKLYRGKKEYLIEGFRSGGWLANDNVFRILQTKKNLVYDASAVDYLFAARAEKRYRNKVKPMVDTIAKELWGPKLRNYNTMNYKATLGSGVGRLTGPYSIGRLIELPNNGMLMPAVPWTDVRNFLDWSLKQPPNRDIYLSIGCHQDSDEEIYSFGKAVNQFRKNKQISWKTHAEYAKELMSSQVPGSSVQGVTKGIGQLG